MKSILTIILTLTLTLSGTTQAKTTVTPPGYGTTEGTAYSYLFGGLSQGRMQFLENSLTGKGLKLVKRVGYRRDKSPANLVGRSWKSVTLDCAATSLAGISTTFSKNRTAPVRVFSAAVSWPATYGAPKSLPAAFTATYSFPFTQSWSYSGKYDALLDYSFSGGTLAINRTWGTGQVYSYYLDAPFSRNYNDSTSIFASGTRPTGCTDSGQPRYAYCVPYGRAWAKNTGDTKTNNKFGFSIISFYTAKSGQVVQAVDFSGSDPGKTFPGVACNRLHLTAGASMLLFYGTADAKAGVLATEFGYMKWNPLFAGVKVWTQAIWDDSVSNRPMLTAAVRATMPKQATGTLARACVYQWDPAFVGLRGVRSHDDFTNPLIQWTH